MVGADRLCLNADPYFIAHVGQGACDRISWQDPPVSPGMTATVDVLTGRKTVLT
jgi:hypothetical protein